MVQVTLEQAEAHLSDLIDQVRAGEEVEILRNGKPAVRVINASDDKMPDNVFYVSDDFDAPLKDKRIPQPGNARGSILYMADDFDAPLEDFKEYMQ